MTGSGVLLAPGLAVLEVGADDECSRQRKC